MDTKQQQEAVAPRLKLISKSKALSCDPKQIARLATKVSSMRKGEYEDDERLLRLGLTPLGRAKARRKKRQQRQQRQRRR